MPAEKAIVLCSGGLNSAVITALARTEHQPILLHVKYAHRAAKKESDLFSALAEHYKITDRLAIEMPHFSAIGGNARVSRKRQIEDALAIGDGPSACHVPGLIGCLLSAAFSYAHTQGATKVFIGVCENLGPPAPLTRSIYPDYSREYIQLWNHLYSIAAPKSSISIETPLIDLDRADIIRLGHRLRTPFDLTWSCVALDSEPCGRCVGCATRNRGFLDAAIPDPILLQAPQPV